VSNFHIGCVCQATQTIEEKQLLEKFSCIRENCSAIKEILLPDAIWPNFQKTALEDMDEAYHKSILLLALKRGYLKTITSPIHRFLIQDERPKNELTRQYISDLQERWMEQCQAIERNRKSRIYFGKLTELILAEWLVALGWKIINLEALGGNADIEARSPTNIDTDIEVKYVGHEDDKFLSVIETMAGRRKAHTASPYIASDFLLFKAYTAAKQLQNSSKARIVFLVISNMSWDFVDTQLSEDWMNWQSPRFFNRDTEWNEFLEEKRKSFPSIDTDLQHVIQSLNELWILREEKPFQYSLKQKIAYSP
jgi:hypothetical protein